MISFTVNGTKVSTEKSEETLLHFLRNDLGLKSVKDGCSAGQCGTCTVIINGKAVRSCTRKLKVLQDAVIETLEGIANEGELHPIQTAFLTCHAFQCGYCTPGMIMAVKALLDTVPDPTDEEIKKALRNNYCRCTGYQQIIEAVHLASKIMRGLRPNEIDNGMGWVGESPASKHGVERVTGKPIYTDDMDFSGAYEGVFLFSKYPHAWIKGIDTAEAEKMPGIVRIFTAKDIPGKNSFCEDTVTDENGDPVILGQPVLAFDRVRYVGEPVCLVIGESVKLARDAADKICVDYDPLPVYVSPEMSLSEGAMRIHSSVKNDYAYCRTKKGNIEEAFKKADIVLKKDFKTHQVDHAILETSVAIARIGEDGRLELFASSQGITGIQKEVCEVLNIPRGKLHYFNRAVAGGFGGREDNICHAAAALAALTLHHSVRVSMTRDEMQAFAPKRHAVQLHYELAAMKDGTIIGLKGEAVGDTGAYSNHGNAVMRCVTAMGAGPYYIPNVEMCSVTVFTNNSVSGGFRGYGSTQTTAAMETLMDELAVVTGIDAYSLRKKNALRIGLQTSVGQVIEYSCGLSEALDAVKRAYEKDGKPLPSSPEKKVGVGFAAGIKNQGFGKGLVDGSGAAIRLTETGAIQLIGGGVELGQGHDTVICQIAATYLGVPYDMVDVAWHDDDITPYTTGSTSASRATYMSGNAVLGACEKFRTTVFKYVRTNFDVEEDSILSFASDGIISEKNDSRKRIPYIEIAKRAAKSGVTLREDYYYVDEKCVPLSENANNSTNSTDHNIYTTYSFSAQIAVVEVDTVTGEVKVLKIYSASDLGRMINPKNVYGQMYGGVIQGMGLCLTERWELENGIVKTKGYRALGVPDITKMPEIMPIGIEELHPHGPYNAKGFSEGCLNTTTPAILNAIYDAVGIRINSIPVGKIQFN